MNAKKVFSASLCRMLFLGLTMLCASVAASGQTASMRIHLKDGSIVTYSIDEVDSITMEETPRWPERSEEARALLTYLEENVGEHILTGTHACVNYNTNEADWVYKHTGKYPAINCIDFIHDIYSASGSWINYVNKTTWKNWVNKNCIMAALWHWNMPTNDGTDYTCTPGSGNGETGFRPSSILDPTSEGYSIMINRIDQVAQWLKPMAEAHVPVLWRPLHEAQGNWTEKNPGTSWHKAWFWWGIDGPEPFVELWHVMYDRLVHYHGLTNLIWVFNTGDSMKWYPGDEYVDIVAYDFYDKSVTEMHQWYDFMHRNFPDKLYAISEFGNIPPLSQLWADGQHWSYMIPWYDYDRTNNTGNAAFKKNEHQHADIDYWNDVINCPFAVTRDQLPSFR